MYFNLCSKAVPFNGAAGVCSCNGMHQSSKSLSWGILASSHEQRTGGRSFALEQNKAAFPSSHLLFSSSLGNVAIESWAGTQHLMEGLVGSSWAPRMLLGLPFTADALSSCSSFGFCFQFCWEPPPAASDLSYCWERLTLDHCNLIQLCIKPWFEWTTSPDDFQRFLPWFWAFSIPISFLLCIAYALL